MKPPASNTSNVAVPKDTNHVDTGQGKTWSDPSSVKRHGFQTSFNAYFDQVLNGCNNAACTTPTCATFRKRISRVPFRPYTVLSARAIAAHLLSVDNRTRKLCPYIQKSQSRSDLSPAFANDLQPVTDEAVGDGEKLADETKARSNDHSSQLQTREEGQLLRISGSCDNQLGSPTSSIPQKGIATLQVSSKGKDPGSLVQSMFDATPWDFERDSHKNEKAPAVADQVSLSSLTYGRRSNSMDYKRLGRTDYFLSHTCGPGENEVHSLDVGHFLCGKIRSCDEILRRFVVEFGRAKTACVKYSSINFLLIVKYLSRSRCVVSHPQSVFSCLWVNAKSLYVTNPTFSSAQAAARRFQPIPNSSISPLEQREELSEVEIAHIAKVILATLVASVRIPSLEAWVAVQKLRKSGHIALPAPSGDPPIPAEVISLTLEMLDAFDNDLAHALIVRLCTAVACRYHVENLHRQIELGGDRQKSPPHASSLDLLVRSIVDSEAIIMERPESYACKVFNEEDYPKITEDWTTATCLELVIEWLRGVILREWNGKAEIQKCSAVGGVLELMSSIYNYYGGRCVTCESFETPYVAETLDILLMPGTWMEFGGDNNLIHLLNYPFLFRPSTLVSFFRAINHAAMAKAYHEAKINAKLVESLGFSSRETGQGNLKSDDRVRRLTEENLFLTIRRDNILTDAFDQLWRRQQQELTRPLKVILGEDEGEEGEDHGGIQQEFLRLATAEFMDPKYGTFTTDSVTGMAWFQPSSLEPLYKFELFGLLTSLAIYNGLTLPFNLPIAFYMKLLNHPPSHLEDIEDGWPELAKGLKALKDWSDGDVEDTFCRAYQFSVDVFGTAQSVDMMPPSKSSPTTSRSSSPGIPMVTNANRHQYIQDYIYHLTTTSIEPQYEAFAKGFKAIINPKSLDLFTVTALQTLIQGVPKINTHDLEAVTKYEGGYFAEHYIIKHFWSIVHGWASGQGSEGPFSQNKEEAMEIGQARVQQLLEFVTASDRLPVGGEARVAFVVQKNGVGDERLPTSLTCFGRLLLPEYTSRWKTEKMLERAVENARGFGQP